VIKLSRRYSDTQGYHRTNSFHERDLANAELVLHAARRYLTLNTITPRAGQPGSPNQVNSGELDTDDHSS
jgi:hypothetical protein